MALCTFLRRQRERQLRRQAQRERQPVRELERLERRESRYCFLFGALFPQMSGHLACFLIVISREHL